MTRRTSLAVSVLLVLASAACSDRTPPAGDGRSPTEPGTPTPPPPGTTVISFYQANPGPLVRPIGLAQATSGEILVADAERQNVTALDPRFLTPVSGFRVAGVPTAVAASRDKVFVGNSTTGRVEVFDYYGHYHFSIGASRLQRPTGIAIDSIAEMIFVLDGGTREVHAFDYSGRHLERVAGPGSSPNTLAMPSGITVDARRAELLVTDYGLPSAAAVKRFGYGGQDLGSVSGEQLCGGGSCSEGFSRPTGVSVDGSGRLVITDAILAQILVLDRESGEILLRVGSREDLNDPLRLPMDVLVGRDGAVYAASSRTSAVVRFDSTEFPR